jgi:transcriptional regulator with XRE-family HTH domain
MRLGEAVAANVRSLRARNRWTQSELADALHISQRAVSTLESEAGRADVGIQELVDLCRAFKVPLAELLRGADPADLRALGL